MSHDLARLLYLLASVLFILGLRAMSSPKAARGGNLMCMLAMARAVGVALVSVLLPEAGHGIEAARAGWIVGAMALGSLAGWLLATRIEMTAMPQMVALLHGLGGLAAALVSVAEARTYGAGASLAQTLVTGVGGVLLGAATFAASMGAFAKLQGLVSGAPLTFRGQRTVNLLLLAAALACCGLYSHDPAQSGWLMLALCLSLAFGLLFVAPIGGADMPVVLALLNASGVAGSAAGYVLGNDVLVVAGAMVGSSGVILSVIMCKAMNRSLGNVLFGAFGAEAGEAAGDAPQRSVKSYTPLDAAVLLGNARSVIIVPGYGLAVAQAQHVVKELTDLLERRGADVKFAVHPVAGRMPGHMNVLLAESNVPYAQLLDMEEVNPMFESADVALVVGANDVVNPVARTDRSSPIYGMPILDADKAQNVIILKRSLASGFAGIDNPLFYADKTMMLFGDAKKTLMALVTELKAG
ncbi:MAG: NAD(P)(+) transhydrogenase (Re/Si-specific) subunit beta [Planctomycetia bacterium]